MPDSTVPYLISFWFARSFALLIGLVIRSIVKNAAKFAVYELIRIKVKNHQTAPTILPGNDLNESGKEIKMNVEINN